MKWLIFLLLMPLVYADTTFFDNPDEFFIMADLPIVEEAPSGGGGDYKKPCYSLWVCDKWSYCYNGLRNRICNDINDCDSEEKPPLLLSCSEPLPSDRIKGCVTFLELNKIIFGWKINIFRFDILNEVIYKWKRNIDC